MRLTFVLAIAVLTLFAGASAVGQSSLRQLEQGLPGPGGAPAGSGAAAAAATGYLGAELDDEGEQGKGVRVTKVKPDAPAEKSGLKEADLITTINGKAVTSVDGYDQLAKGPPGTKLQMTVVRAGRPQLITVTLGTRPVTPIDQNQGETPALSQPATSPSSSAGAPSLIPPTGSSTPATQPGPGAVDSGTRTPGIRASQLELPPPPPETPGSAPPGPGSSSFPAPSAGGGGGASLGITVDVFTRGSSSVPIRRGAVITQVKAGSPADQAGLPVGAVIVSIDGRRVDSSDDLVSAIRAARPGQEVELTYYVGSRPDRKAIRLAAAGGSAAPGSGALSAPGPAAAPGGRGASGTTGSVENPPPPSFRAAPAADAPFRATPGGGAGRPLLQKIEQLADNLARPTGTTTVYDPLAMAALQTRVVELSEQMKALEDRLKALESKLGTGAPATSAPPGSPTTPGFGSPTPPPAAPGFGPAPGGTGTNP